MRAGQLRRAIASLTNSSLTTQYRISDCTELCSSLPNWSTSLCNRWSLVSSTHTEGHTPAGHALAFWRGSKAASKLDAWADEQERAAKGFVGGQYALTEFPPDRIRNLSIIAHVDHGKSTLADRLLERTGALSQGQHAQYLDKLQVEKERGITVKAQTVSLVYYDRPSQQTYLLNLIDTPGHVDFSYEVSRSLSACQGVILLVDATQGIQAQTVANFYLAFDQGLSVVPVLNKIDMPAARVEEVAEELQSAFDVAAEDCIAISAKTGQGIDSLLPVIVDKIPGPTLVDSAVPMKLLLFDAYHDDFRGVVCLVEVIGGQLRKGNKLTAASTGLTYEALEVGVLSPEMVVTDMLLTGQVGYLIMGIKSTKAVRVGDTLFDPAHPVEPLPGFKPAKSMVYAGIFPVSADEFDLLSAAMERLTLNDASVIVKRENSNALGAGFRCGFLGLLHMEVFHQRLEQEYGASVITTAPTVPCRIEVAGATLEIDNPASFPLNTKIHKVWEPTLNATIIAPSEYVGKLMAFVLDRRGEMQDHVVLGNDRTLLKYVLPMSELGGNFYDELKSLTSGFASFDYEEGEYRAADLVRLDILVNGEVVDALARIVHREKATRLGRQLVEKLKDLLDRQQFEVALQAAANNKVVARETLKAYRKNVTAKCYGGDITRKRKLLEKQKEGKKRMKKIGTVDVSQDVFHQLMKAGS